MPQALQRGPNSAPSPHPAHSCPPDKLPPTPWAGAPGLPSPAPISCLFPLRHTLHPPLRPGVLPAPHPPFLLQTPALPLWTQPTDVLMVRSWPYLPSCKSFLRTCPALLTWVLSLWSSLAPSRCFLNIRRAQVATAPSVQPASLSPSALVSSQHTPAPAWGSDLGPREHYQPQPDGRCV